MRHVALALGAAVLATAAAACGGENPRDPPDTVPQRWSASALAGNGRSVRLAFGTAPEIEVLSASVERRGDGTIAVTLHARAPGGGVSSAVLDVRCVEVALDAPAADATIVDGARDDPRALSSTGDPPRPTGPGCPRVPTRDPT